MIVGYPHEIWTYPYRYWSQSEYADVVAYVTSDMLAARDFSPTFLVAFLGK